MAVRKKRICLFCGGRFRSLEGTASDANALVAKYSKDKKAAEEFRRWHFGFLDYEAGPARYVATQLCIRPNGLRRTVTHSFARREKAEPGTVFIAVASEKKYEILTQTALTAYRERTSMIRKLVENMRSLPTTIVHWEELAPRDQARFQDSDLTPDQCWIWRPLPYRRTRKKPYTGKNGEAAPYRDFYRKLVGPLPDGVLLRHTCHNRLCMNPNHLIPGTHPENMQDMVAAGRHPKQVLARKRAKARRRAQLLRKKRQMMAIKNNNNRK